MSEKVFRPFDESARQDLIKVCRDYRDAHGGGYVDDDFRAYIAEEAMEYVFGSGIWQELRRLEAHAKKVEAEAEITRLRAAIDGL